MPLNAEPTIETLRAFIAVVETGSLSKAAARLGVSQPSVSAQMKRLQNYVGGALLTKGAHGTAVTQAGQLALNQARRVIETLDQLLAMSGSGAADKPLRLAVSTVLLPLLVRAGVAPKDANVCLIADHCREIERSLIEGYVDIGCGFASPSGLSGLEALVLTKRPISFAWAKSKSLAVSPGNPLPIIGLPDDDYMIRPLQRSATVFRFTLQTADMQARFEAARAGLGFCAAPLAVIPPDLVVAKESYLPKLDPLDVYICCRPEFDQNKASSVMRCLERALFAPAASGEGHAALEVAAEAGLVGA